MHARMYRIYASKPQAIRPRRTYTMECTSYHRPSPSIPSQQELVFKHTSGRDLGEQHSWHMMTATNHYYNELNG